MLRLELRKNLLSIRALPLYLLAALPLFVLGLFIFVSSIQGLPDDLESASGATIFFAGTYQFILVMVYFGCVWIFMNLFRGEVLDRSLHYYFLCPVRREVLVAGKYVSALASTAIVFSLVTSICFVVTHAYLGSPGTGTLVGHMVRYVGVATLGCLGYGAVFMVVGLFIRNPVVPGLIIFVWEYAAMPWLPPLFKKVSVLFYLQSLLPVPPGTDSIVAFIADPIPAWLSVPGLLVFTGAMLLIAGLRIRTMEISYSSD
jgi:ABC-type transport system involved in multi-copper enzyme maturation permease subunit